MVVFTLILPGLVNPYLWLVALGMLLYWNALGFVASSMLAFTWMLFVMQLYIPVRFIGTIVAYSLRRPSTVAVDVHVNPTNFAALMLEVLTLVVYAGSTSEQWLGALATRVLLYGWMDLLRAWLDAWDYTGWVAHLAVPVNAVLVMMCCALQWSYYVTLPQSQSSISDSTATQLLWYASVMYVVDLALDAAGVLWKSCMHLFGLSLTARVLHVVYPAHPTVANSILDPNSEESGLSRRWMVTVLRILVAWVYAPPAMGAVFQFLVLLRVYSAFAASGDLRRYQKILDQFPSVPAASNTSCVICLEDFREGEMVKRLPCGHTFHGSCVRRWLLRNGVCPVCRRPMARDGVAADVVAPFEVREVVPPPRPVARPAAPAAENGAQDGSWRGGHSPPPPPPTHAGATPFPPPAAEANVMVEGRPVAVAPPGAPQWPPRGAAPPHIVPPALSGVSGALSHPATGATPPHTTESVDNASGLGTRAVCRRSTSPQRFSGSLQPLAPRLPPPPRGSTDDARRADANQRSVASEDELSQVEAMLSTATARRKRAWEMASAAIRAINEEQETVQHAEDADVDDLFADEPLLDTRERSTRSKRRRTEAPGVAPPSGGVGDRSV